MSAPNKKIAIIVYTLYGHIGTLAESIKVGIGKQGLQADILQVPETLPENVLKILHAPPKPDYPIATVDTFAEYSGFMFGIPTRFGNMPTQFKTLIDGTGGLWAKGALHHKPFGLFVSTGTGGGNEMTAVSSLSTFVHHSMIYVPLGFASAGSQLSNLSEPHGGSAWGSGCLAGADGSRQVSELEKEIAQIQGEDFAKAAKKLII